GYYVRNSLFPKLTEELQMDPKKITTNRYLLLKDPLFTQREERLESHESGSYMLEDKDAIVIGLKARHPFTVKGQIGMSAMSYGSLVDGAITELSDGLGIAGGIRMNSGDGGVSDHHLKGGVDIIMQVVHGLFGVWNLKGTFNWVSLLAQSQFPEVNAFQMKLSHVAKTRGGHLGG